VPISLDEVARTAVELAVGAVLDATSADSPAVELLHVGRSPGVSADLGDFSASLKEDLEQELRAFAATLDIEIPNLSLRVELGAVQQVVPEVVAATGADLVCMASRSSGGFLGSTVDAVLRNVAVPMLVVYLAD
jgi:nucleotide-binding universal stress UspA family protein